MVKNFTNTSVTFEQIIKIKETGKICTVAEVRATATDKNGRIIRDIGSLIGLKSENTDRQCV